MATPGHGLADEAGGEAHDARGSVDVCPGLAEQAERSSRAELDADALEDLEALLVQERDLLGREHVVPVRPRKGSDRPSVPHVLSLLD